MKNKNFGRKRQAIYISSNKKSTRIIKTLVVFFFFIKVKIKMVCFSVSSEVWGGVPAHYIMKTKDYADKCKENTPVYDLENYRKNFREEVNLICDRMEHSM